jgi:hypothetical protein
LNKTIKITIFTLFAILFAVGFISIYYYELALNHQNETSGALSPQLVQNWNLPNFQNRTSIDGYTDIWMNEPVGYTFTLAPGANASFPLSYSKCDCEVFAYDFVGCFSSSSQVEIGVESENGSFSVAETSNSTCVGGSFNGVDMLLGTPDNSAAVLYNGGDNTATVLVTSPFFYAMEYVEAMPDGWAYQGP